MIRDITTDTIIARTPKLARSFAWRLRGMIGRRFDGFDALVFPRCNSVHTMFMRMPLDIIFVGRDRQVVGTRQALCPWHAATCGDANTVVELPAGTLLATPVCVGDLLDLPQG